MNWRFRTKPDEPLFVCTIDEWEAEMLKPRTFRQKIDRLWYQLTNELPWWFRHRFDPRHRYHVVKTGLRPGYYDIDFRMEAALITLFKNYVEIEKPWEMDEASVREWEADDLSKEFQEDWASRREGWKEARDLYAYFKKIDVNHMPYEIPIDFKPREVPFSVVKDHDDREQAARDELTENLCALLRLRGRFWT